MSLKRIALAIPLSLALIVAAPSMGWADDEAPAPKKIRIKLKKQVTEQANVRKSPMPAIHKWLRR